jgi:hypothetical protein
MMPEEHQGGLAERFIYPPISVRARCTKGTATKQ